jgi:hypothetical protein
MKIIKLNMKSIKTIIQKIISFLLPQVYWFSFLYFILILWLNFDNDYYYNILYNYWDYYIMYLTLPFCIVYYFLSMFYKNKILLTICLSINCTIYTYLIFYLPFDSNNTSYVFLLFYLFLFVINSIIFYIKIIKRT